MKNTQEKVPLLKIPAEAWAGWGNFPDVNQNLNIPDFSLCFNSSTEVEEIIGCAPACCTYPSNIYPSSIYPSDLFLNFIFIQEFTFECMGIPLIFYLLK